MRQFYYLLCFLEGASVMAAELLGAKMMAPYFGSSLYVWASVLGVTLGGLAMGYFTGGVVSENKNSERNLYIVLLASAIFLTVMPLTAKEIMLHTSGFSLLVSILISSLIFLFPPIFFMGMVSPMVIKCLAESDMASPKSAGKTAGMVYAISTVGGILATFLLGFYLIPEFGLTKPAIVTGCLLGIIPFIKLIVSKKFFSLVFPLAAFLSFSSLSQTSYSDSEVKVLYSSEGLLGQIVVADYPLYEGEKQVEGSQRILFVNRSTQTVVENRNGKKSFFEYVQMISEKTENKKGNALVLGLGGGSVATAFSEKGFDVTAVELDERMAGCAKKYFYLDEKVNVHIDDARHFINQQSLNHNNSSRYDVIVLDAFVGEVNPHHLFAKEFFSEIKIQLADSGLFFINGNGFWNDEAGIGMRSVCKTLIHSGFDVEIIPTSEQEDYRNLLFVCSKSSKDVGEATSERINSFDLSKYHILTDEKPRLEILNAEANKKWREACMKYFLSGYYSGHDKLLFR